MSEDKIQAEITPDNGNTPGTYTRREFIRQAAAGTVALAVAGTGVVGLFGSKPVYQIEESSGFILPDPTLCIGCLTCEVICSKVHEEQGLSAIPRIRIYNNPTTVVDAIITDAYGDRGQYHQSPCLQCPDAPCHYVCPVDALPIEPTTGARIILEDTCIACGRCTEACPFPTPTEDRGTNRIETGQGSRITFDPALNTYTKCDLCYWRPEGPACVERCPVNIRIEQGILQSDRLCLSAPAATRSTWEQQSELDWDWNL
jgi:Fe-S-cluster-containing hydrogenase component 2